MTPQEATQFTWDLFRLMGLIPFAIFCPASLLFGALAIFGQWDRSRRLAIQFGAIAIFILFGFGMVWLVAQQEFKFGG